MMPERSFTHGIDPTDGQAGHVVIDRSHQHATPTVGHQTVQSSGAHQGLGQQARLPPGEEGAAPHLLEGVEGPAAQFAAAVSVAPYRQSGCFDHRCPPMPGFAQAPLLGVDAGQELLDAIENGAPVPLGLLMGPDLDELGPRQSGQALDDLGGRQAVVAGNGQRTGRSVAVGRRRRGGRGGRLRLLARRFRAPGR